MRRQFALLLAAMAAPLLVLMGCGAGGITLGSGQTFNFGPDLSVRLASTHPTLAQLRLEVTILATGKTPIESLIPAILVTPDGGQELSSSLEVQSDRATIAMLLSNAQHVAFVSIQDARNGRAARWNISPNAVLAPCPATDNCGVLSLPRSAPAQPHP